VASYDEDTTSMGVEAARLALRPVTDRLGDAARGEVQAVWFSTTDPSYLDKTNATTVHAALRLDRQVPAMDLNGAVRSGPGALRAALHGAGTTLVVASDRRTGLPNSPDETQGGDGASAFLVGDGSGDLPVLAELIGSASITEEFVDRWRVPGEPRSRSWEERFGETRYVPLGTEGVKLALEDAGVAPDAVAAVIVAGTHARAVRQVGAKASAGTGGLADDLTASVGNIGAAHAGLVLADVLDRAEPGQVVVVVSLADGCDVLVLRATDAIADHRPHRTVAAQLAAGNDALAYLNFLAWTGMVTVQPPNRPEPARASSSAAARNAEWKYGFVGSEDRESGALHLPPARVSYQGGNLDDMVAHPMAEATGTIVTFTVDRLAYSPSPPIVFAVVDFAGPDGSPVGRLPVELTDVDASDVALGEQVELTFRRLNASDGIQNYFWKAKKVRS
jgi:3-hydroxy-3-methylglutaryl CoA synthase